MGAILLTQTAIAAPTAVSLGTAAPFAILSGDGITNVPTSVILGNVGVSPNTGASITGLTCLEVTGTIYTVDAAGPSCRTEDAGLLTIAKNALTTAYDNASALSPDTTYLAADDQLGGKTLTAGTYRFGGASTANLSGSLILSGSSTDVWVFQATSTLVTAATSTVSFIGGAQACNVFWTVGSAATLGANSTFAGTILAHDDISLNANVTVAGRLLAGGQANHAGAVTLIQDTIVRSDCAIVAPPTSSPTVAPVATPTAVPGATPTAAPGATPTAVPGIPTLAPGASPTAAAAVIAVAPTAAPSANLPSTNTLSPASPESGPVIVGYLLLILLATVSIVIARLPGRARR